MPAEHVSRKIHHCILFRSQNLDFFTKKFLFIQPNFWITSFVNAQSAFHHCTNLIHYCTFCASLHACTLKHALDARWKRRYGIGSQCRESRIAYYRWHDRTIWDTTSEACGGTQDPPQGPLSRGERRVHSSGLGEWQQDNGSKSR